MKVIDDSHELMIASEEGVVIRVSAGDISELGRATQGVKVMNVGENDRVVAVARLVEGGKKKESDGLVEGQDELLSDVSGRFNTSTDGANGEAEGEIDEAEKGDESEGAAE